jgi:XTP/dITP diphosphohydrolase
MDIIIASNNKHKVIEIKSILKDKFDNIFSMRECGCSIEPVEDGETCEENALIKAKTISEALLRPVIADDSGLFAKALGDNEPGVLSARYAGEGATDDDNNKKLIARLKELDKSAYFMSVVVLYYPDGKYYVGKGYCYGKIIDEYRGSNGFGYDPIFVSDELGKTFGEATEAEKNSVSHRANALADLVSKL